MQDTTIYPQFIPDKPSGKDCFEGHSQDKLAHSVCDYVWRADAVSEGKADDAKESKKTLPRIIGLEGDWGSGKSNVVSMIEGELKGKGYYTFTYDAWGHQEDLQRRSILETLTGKLITDKVLHGKVKIPMRNGKMNEASWGDQLSLLLSNKTTTIRHSVPHLSGAVVWGICLVAAFAVLTVISGILLEKVTCFPVWVAILMDLLPVIIGFSIASHYRCKDGNWDRTLKLISQREDDTVDEEYTSSEEPSVSEFKNWMRAVSNYLGSNNKRQYKKLIIVFDNMDRLPSDKVMQLWSSIYTFFAGGEFENIWAIIPYDYTHLCQAIYGCEECDTIGEKDAERIKQFISKTFPITYRVPQPVITDYRKLFNTYFDEAFGPKVHDKEHICQVFMHLNDQPNPRTVIQFVNELVAMHLQWSNKKYRLQNQALYILKKDYLFYQGKHLETQLLSDKLFDKISPFYPDRDKVRTELCQYAYGLDDEKLANELPLHNELKRLIADGKSVKEYVAKPNFLSVFEKVMASIDQASLDHAVMSMASLDDAELSSDIKEGIQGKWDFLANLKGESHYDSHEYDEKLTILISHAKPKRVNQMARSFVASMQRIKVTDGASYFQAQHKLQLALKDAKVTFDDSDWYQPTLCDAEQFVQYVCEAKELYTHYGLTTDVKLLNEYLLNGATSGNSQVATVVVYIKDDSNYDLSDLKNGLSTAIVEDSIKQDIHVAAYVNRVLSQDKALLKVRFNKDTVSTYIRGDQTPWAEKLPVGLEDVMAMSLADGNDINEVDDVMIPRICACMSSYLTYTEVLKHTGSNGSAFRKLNIYCIEHQKGSSLDTIYVARHLHELQASLGLDIAAMLKQFNRWQSIKWGELNADNEYVKDVKNYVQKPLFNDYLDNPGHFSDSIIKLGVEALSLQKKGFLALPQQVHQNYNRIITVLNIDDYWKNFVETYLGTNYMQEADELLTTEAVTMLQWLYDHNEVKDATLLNTILQHPNEATLRSYLHTMMNDHLSKTDINKEKFLYFGKLLPKLGADMDDNTARGLITHFIKPIFNDADSAAIIIDHKDFYISVMRHDKAMVSDIVKKMVEKEEYATIAEELKALVVHDEDK